MRLTAKERILLYLLEIAKPTETVEAPPEMTQEAVSEGSGVDLRHLTQYVRPLIQEGLVRERRAHVKGIRQRRKVYDLTEAGKMAAVRLRERVKAETVRVRDDAGVRDVTIAKLLEGTPRKASLTEIVRQAAQGGIVDLSAEPAARGPTFLQAVEDMPRVDRFVGRRQELDAVTRGTGPSRVFVIRGVAGIGKSTLAAKACEVYRGSRNLFWHRIRSWDTPQSVLSALATFLAGLGRPGLRAVLSRGETNRAPKILRDDLPGTNAFLVIDDAHEATTEVVSFLRFLKEAIAVADDVRAVLLTRRTVPFYDRRDVAVHRLVTELELGGLDPEAVAVFLTGEPEGLGALAREYGGHPLLLKLLRSAPRTVPPSEIRRDARRFIEETIYTELTEPERTMMKVASLYRVPVPRNALLLDPSWSHDVFLALSDRSLLSAIGDERYEVHDTIREFFTSVLTPAEQEGLGVQVASRLQDLAAAARRAGDIGVCLDALSNALQVSPPGEQRTSILEALGDARERIGDFPGGLIAYKEALQSATDGEVRARLRRKVAAAFEVRSELASATEEVERGLEELGTRSSVERAWLDIVRCRIAAQLEEWEEARQHAEAALQTFRGFGARSGEAHALLAIGRVETTEPSSDPSLAEQHLLSALALAGSVDEPEFPAIVRIDLAHLYAYRLGRVDDVIQQLAEIEAAAATLMDPHRRRGLLMLKGWFNLRQLADYEAARAFFSEARTLGRRVYDANTVLFAQFGLTCVEYYQGQTEKAGSDFERLASEICDAGFPAYAVECAWMAAECALMQRDLAGFRRMVRFLGKPSLERGVEARKSYVSMVRGLQCLLDGDSQGSEKILIESLGSAPAGFEVDAALPHFVYGVALRAQGRDREAEAHISQAMGLYKKYRFEADLASLAVREQRLAECLRTATTRA